MIPKERQIRDDTTTQTWQQLRPTIAFKVRDQVDEAQFPICAHIKNLVITQVGR